MKCLKSSTNDSIVRAIEKEAIKMVASGNWVYIQKKEWKEKVRDKKDK